MKIPEETQRIKNRVLMLDLFPKAGVIAELGVFRGVFSERILERCNPKKLYLVDLWSDPTDWILNGELHHITGPQAYEFVRRLELDKRVALVRSYTTQFLTTLADKFLDVAYLDACHTYESVRDELALVFPRMKSGGWIAGHDYCELFPGVIQAVTEFITLRKLKLNVLTDEVPSAVINCPGGPASMAYNSFAIKVP